MISTSGTMPFAPAWSWSPATDGISETRRCRAGDSPWEGRDHPGRRSAGLRPGELSLAAGSRRAGGWRFGDLGAAPGHRPWVSPHVVSYRFERARKATELEAPGEGTRPTIPGEVL
jgi:hypothetical protein